MFLDKKPFIFLWRPFYWLVFEMVIHPILNRIWTYLLLQPLPPNPPPNSLAARLHDIERIRESLGRTESALAESKQEWAATERLVVALLQDSGTPAPTVDSSRRTG
jgi:hypothetical protein